MKPPVHQPRHRDAAVIVALLLVAGTVWLLVLGPLGGRSGWYTLAAIAALLLCARLADPWIRCFSRWVTGKRKRRGGAA